MHSQPFVAAMRRYCSTAVVDLQNHGASVNAKDGNGGWSPLQFAAAVGGGREMTQLLMLKGADTNAMDDRKSTPLYTAHAAVAEALLASGADVNLRYGQLKMSVMHQAAQFGHVDILRAAIEHGADVDARNVENKPQRFIRPQCSTRAKRSMFSPKRGPIKEHSHTPVHDACVQLSLEALSSLMKHGAPTNAQNVNLLTPLHLVASQARPGDQELPRWWMFC